MIGAIGLPILYLNSMRILMLQLVGFCSSALKQRVLTAWVGKTDRRFRNPKPETSKPLL